MFVELSWMIVLIPRCINISKLTMAWHPCRMYVRVLSRNASGLLTVALSTQLITAAANDRTECVNLQLAEAVYIRVSCRHRSMLEKLYRFLDLPPTVRYPGRALKLYLVGMIFHLPHQANMACECKCSTHLEPSCLSNALGSRSSADVCARC